MLPIPATRIRDVIPPRSPLHPPHLHVPARVRKVDETNDYSCGNDDRYDGHGRPSHYFHFELLSVSGSTSSGAKYRSRPYQSCRSAAGSSSSTTPTCWSPSTSSCTEVTRAILSA